jgi:type I restriction enzyme S subunit
MGLSKYRLGDLIEQVTEINSNLQFGVNDVVGMTITKEIIPTKANLTGTDLSHFLVVKPHDFVFNPRTHGKKIGFGYNDSNNSYIVSWNNIAFKIKEFAKAIILSDYLFLNFRRDEWDREACYQSWGTSTEVFTWEALCDMRITIPALSTQQKYVAIYKAMVANQQSYERGLEDLKLGIDAQIDVIKHTATKTPVVELLREVNTRNSDGAIKNVQGINISKQFMPSVADTNGVDLTKYKVVQKGQFAFSGMQTGRDECIRIALCDTEQPIIISPAYTVLELKDQTILPEYIMLWFLRGESDRRGWFISDSSVRTNLDLERFWEIKIPIPEEKLRIAIAELYTVYNTRTKINEQLKAQIKDICPILIRGSLEENGI